MDEQQLQVIKERAEKATEGTWEWKKDSLGSDELYSEDEENIHEIITAGCGQNVGFVRIKEDDAEFIKHARQDVPALVAEIERLKHLNDAFISDAEKYANYPSEYEKLLSESIEMKKENKRLREVLAFYADKENWKFGKHKAKCGTIYATISQIEADGGQVACKVLEEGLDEQG